MISNYLTDIAERAGDAFRRGKARSQEAAQAYLDDGALLIEAKAACAHGEWLPFLSRADIPRRTASRIMRIAESGLDAETLVRHGTRAIEAHISGNGKWATEAHLEEAVEDFTRSLRAWHRAFMRGQDTSDTYDEFAERTRILLNVMDARLRQESGDPTHDLKEAKAIEELAFRIEKFFGGASQ